MTPREPPPSLDPHGAACRGRSELRADHQCYALLSKSPPTVQTLPTPPPLPGTLLVFRIRPLVLRVSILRVILIHTNPLYVNVNNNINKQKSLQIELE